MSTEYTDEKLLALDQLKDAVRQYDKATPLKFVKEEGGTPSHWQSRAGEDLKIWNDIIDKPAFADVAASGNYNDLNNKPTIPTKVSDLENDSGYLKRVDCTKAEYDALDTKGHETVYVVEVPEYVTEGTAYGVLSARSDDGVDNSFVFFRSNETYENGQEGTFIGLFNDTYEGKIYADVEDNYFKIPMDIGAGGFGFTPKTVKIAKPYGIVFPAGKLSVFKNLRTTESLDLEGFDTSQITDMSRAFADSKLFEELDLTYLDTHSVTNMNGMFAECDSLKVLDLSNLNIDNATQFDNMFKSCPSLTTIYAKNWYDLKPELNPLYPFQGCSSLPGFRNNTYYWGWEYARIQPDGYFTDPATKPTN